jgi:hypothetical protein
MSSSQRALRWKRICDAGTVRRSAALLVAAMALMGCGGKPAAPKASAGCAGLRTAPHSTSFLTLFGAMKLLTPKFVCAHFGAPQKITQGADGRVNWFYGSAVLVFRGSHAVEGAGFNR